MGAQQLNIKDAETIRLARRLADATGEPITQVIKGALQREFIRREEELQAKAYRVQEISREFRAHMPEEWDGKSARELINELYDDDGLPI